MVPNLDTPWPLGSVEGRLLMSFAPRVLRTKVLRSVWAGRRVSTRRSCLGQRRQPERACCESEAKASHTVEELNGSVKEHPASRSWRTLRPQRGQMKKLRMSDEAGGRVGGRSRRKTVLAKIALMTDVVASSARGVEGPTVIATSKIRWRRPKVASNSPSERSVRHPPAERWVKPS